MSTIYFTTVSTLETLENFTHAATTASYHETAEETNVPKAVGLVLLMVLSLAANISVCVVVFRDRELRILMRNLALSSFACANLLMVQVLFFCILNLLGAIKGLPEQACVMFTRLYGILVYVSILHLFALSIDKYVAVFYPLNYAQKITVKRLVIGLLLVWLIPTITVGVTPEGKDEKAEFRLSGSFAECILFPAYSKSERQRYSIVLNAIFLFGIPLLCMLVTYFKIAKVSWYQSNRCEHKLRNAEALPRCGRIRVREMKWAKTIGIMIGAFILCYLPIIVMFLYRACNYLDQAVSEAILLLSFANTLINPVVYCLRSRSYRKALLKMCNKDSVVITGCTASNKTRGSRKVGPCEQKQSRAPSSSGTTSTSHSFVITRALFQSILAEVLEEDGRDRREYTAGQSTDKERNENNNLTHSKI